MAARSTKAIPALLFGALILTGCSAGTANNTSTSGISIDSSPLSEWLDYGIPNAEDASAQAVAQETRYDELAAQCMHDAGFQYLPRTEEGLGSDPRQIAYMDSLSDAEFEAWWAAYWGPDFDQDADGNFIWDFERAGCGGQAQYLVDQEFKPLQQQEEFRPLFEAIDQFYENLLARPEFVALDSDWSYCMANAGHRNLVRPDTIQTAETASTANEIADLNCQTETDYLTRVKEIIFTAENQFIKDHKAELKALRAAAEQRS